MCDRHLTAKCAPNDKRFKTPFTYRRPSTRNSERKSNRTLGSLSPVKQLLGTTNRSLHCMMGLAHMGQTILEPAAPMRVNPPRWWRLTLYRTPVPAACRSISMIRGVGDPNTSMPVVASSVSS